ncbi:MAG: hypothetical protein JW769_01490 [Parachlamydiales bacterium]|nr:hypothetical protein [Parachlamydiales bacterium]
MKKVGFLLLFALFSIGFCADLQESSLDRIDRSIDKAIQSIVRIQANSADTAVLRNQMVDEILKKEHYFDEALEILIYDIMQNIPKNAPDLNEKLVLIHSAIVGINIARKNIEIDQIKEIRRDLNELKKFMKKTNKISNRKNSVTKRPIQ